MAARDASLATQTPPLSSPPDAHCRNASHKGAYVVSTGWEESVGTKQPWRNDFQAAVEDTESDTPGLVWLQSIVAIATKKMFFGCVITFCTATTWVVVFPFTEHPVCVSENDHAHTQSSV